jgi:hypothetical protein
MLLNLKFDKIRRSILFENQAKLLLRKENKNNFIFLTRNFSNFEEIILKYRIKINHFNKDIIELLKNGFSSIDIIEFKLESSENRFIKEIILYEVKTKLYEFKYNHELCLSSFYTYHKAKELGIKTKLISFVLFEDWRYSFNICELNLKKISVYSRSMKNRAEARERAKELGLI